MNNLTNITTTVANVALTIFVLGALFLILWLVLYSCIASYISEKRYQKSAISILKSKCEYEIIKKQIKQVYQTYSTSNSSYLNIVQLNSKLISDLHDKKMKECNDKEIVEYCDILTKLNDDFNDENLYNDDKLTGLLKKIDDISLKNEVKSMFLCITSYNNGRLHEKNNYINELKLKISKIKKGRIISHVVGAVGFVGSLITIFTAFK